MYLAAFTSLSTERVTLKRSICSVVVQNLIFCTDDNLKFVCNSLTSLFWETKLKLKSEAFLSEYSC